MRALPPALAPWSNLPDVFPETSAGPLSQIIARLAPLIGPLSARGRRHDEPDGFGGVSSRGSLHRLLPSEWLLADELPDEFLRRAAMGEQLFLERLEKSGRQGLACAVLFDCGLSQLGSPRLAQLALLILLARRAETARARFSWGVLQDPSFQFTEGVDASGVRRFLRSRSFDTASVAQYDAWTRAAGGWDRFDEVWLIGSPFAHDLPRALRRVEIADVLDPFRRSLEVRLGPRQISLELPGPDQVLGRILRDPFDGSSPSGPPDEFASNILLDHRAARALIRKAPREVHAVTKQTPHSRKAWTTGFDLVFAAGRLYKHYCLAGRLDGELMLHWTRSSAPMPAGPYRVEDAEFALPGTDDRLLPCYPVEAGGNLSVLLLDRHRSLFRLEDTGGGPRARHIAERVLATERFGDSTVVILGRVPGSEHFSLFSFSGAGHIRRLGIGEAVSAFFGSPTQAPFGDVVWSPAGGPWRMLNEPARTFEIEEGSQAVGLVTYPRGDPRMIVLSPDRLSLSLTGRDAALETFRSPIVSVSFCRRPWRSRLRHGRGLHSFRPGAPMSIHPRRTCFTGSVLSAGLWFDARLLGEEAARRSVLAAWKPGSHIHRADGGLLLIWPNPRTIAAGTAHGSPVVRMGGVLSATPLNARELERLAPPLSSLIVIEGGMCRAVALSPGTREDPGAWVDLEGFSVAATMAVAAPPPGPVTFAPGAQAPRQIFGVDPIDGVPRPAKPIGGIRGWLAAFQAARPALTGSGVPLPRRLADFLERLAAIRYSRHFAGLLRQFESGDLDTALRNAIPLGGVEASLQKARLPSLSPPRPRADLSIQLERRGVERSIGLETRFLELLRSYYRSAFEQLAARHRHDEAAFVLTELLQCHEEAVSFLETHGKLERAAQLAEARGLTPALVVRQWFIAGDRRRACLIARRTRAFAEAVALLERDDGAGAEEMRQAWAEQLAASGEYQAAVEVVWPIPSLRATAGPWLENAIAIGGPMGAHALARKAWLMPEAFAAVRAKLTALLDDASLEGAGARQTFAFTLRYGGGPTPQTRTLMRPAIRAVCRDVAMGFTGKALEFHSLIRYAGDASLAADLPGVPAMVENPQTVFSLRADAADSGPTALRHAVWTPGGQILVAAGEGGCRLIDRDGRVTARFAQPCDIIVPSDSGSMALTLARRGEVWKIGRLDLLRRRCQPWCDARLDSFAPHYDGSLWFVGIDGTLHALDATAAGFESIWDVPQAGERIISLDRGGDFLQAQVASGTETEWWRFELPSLTLRHRSSNPPPPLSPYAEVTYEGGIAKVEAEGAVHLELAGSQHAAATIGDYRLVVCDDRGRLIAVDLATRSLLRNLRI